MAFYKKALAGLAIVCIFTVPVQADQETGFYIGAGFTKTDFEGNNFDGTIDQLSLRGGYMINHAFGIELTAIVPSDTIDDGFETEVGMFAISGMGIIPLGEHWDLYGKLGLAQVSTDTEFNGTNQIEEESTELYAGLGVELDFGMVNYYLEYNVFDIDLIDLETLSLGIKLEF